AAPGWGRPSRPACVAGPPGEPPGAGRAAAAGRAAQAAAPARPPPPRAAWPGLRSPVEASPPRPRFGAGPSGAVRSLNPCARPVNT
ncbi:OmpA family protein, partial [Elioraea sp. Yellowstone]